MPGTVELHVESSVANVWLNRPESANAMNVDIANDLHAVCTELAARPDIRCILLRGRGKMFCAGGDVKAFVDDAELVATLLAAWHPALSALLSLDAPIVTAAQGSAAGAGLGLVVASDLVIASRSCKFVMAYTAIGLSPDGATSWFLPRLVGHRRAAELTLLNRVLTAEQAESWGMINNVVDDDKLDAEAEALAAKLAQGPSRAYASARRLLHESSTNTLAQHLHREADEMIANSRSSDGREGITAFAARRKPEFTG